jgi:hypothetical protein
MNLVLWKGNLLILVSRVSVYKSIVKTLYHLYISYPLVAWNYQAPSLFNFLFTYLFSIIFLDYFISFLKLYITLFILSQSNNILRVPLVEQIIKYYWYLEGFVFLDRQFSVYFFVDGCLSRCTFLFLVIGLSALQFTDSDYHFSTFNFSFYFPTIYTLSIYVEGRYILMTLVFWFYIQSSYHYTIYFARTEYQNRLSCVV